MFEAECEVFIESFITRPVLRLTKNTADNYYINAIYLFNCVFLLRRMRPLLLNFHIGSRCLGSSFNLAEGTCIGGIKTSPSSTTQIFFPQIT